MLKIGFDIGIASIGWALVDIDEDAKSYEIIDCGVRIFTAAENPKDRASLALPRREARGARRRLSRRRVRLNAVRALLCHELGLKQSEFESNNSNLPSLFATSKDALSPWELRARALSQKLAPKDLARAIYHIAKHRGYCDLRYQLDDGEGGKVTNAINQNKDYALAHACESGAQMLLTKFAAKEISRLRNGNDSYTNSLPQSMNEAELRLILSRQIEFGWDFSADFAAKLNEEIFFTRPLKDFSNKVGFCVFEEFKKEPRAPKFSPLAQEFIALGKIVNKLHEMKNKNRLYDAEGVVISDFAPIVSAAMEIVLEKGKLTFAQFRKISNLNPAVQIPGVKAKESETLVDIKKCKDFMKIIGASDFDDARANEIASVCTYAKDFDTLKSRLSKFELSEEQIKELLALKFAGNIDLSAGVLRAILPYMRRGMRYDEAWGKGGANLHKKGASEKSKFLPPFATSVYGEQLANPVVARALKEYRKVLNAIIERYGSVHEIAIELTREVGKTREARNKIQKAQEDNAAINAAARAICEQVGLEATKTNILKIKLWREQGEYCAYSGRKITIADLRSPNILEIDHILPYSRSFDDSYSNKVLVFRSENQVKGEHTPYEAWGADAARWERICAFALTLGKWGKSDYNAKEIKFDTRGSKARKMLLENFEAVSSEWKERNFADTSYIATLAKNYTEDALEFLPISGRKQHVFTINGALTSMLRRFWGLEPKDRTAHLHHAADALIVAFAGRGVINEFSRFMSEFRLTRAAKDAEKYKQTVENAVKKSKKGLKFEPLPNLRENIEKAVGGIFVSRPPRKKVTGALHEETVRPRAELVKKYKSERGLAVALATRRIRELNGGYVDNGEMPRVDIFAHKKTGKFYAVPIYAMDFALGILPNQACVAGKDKEGNLKEWLEMDENYEFKFSLFKDDLIQIQKSDMKEPILCYFESLGIATASIRVNKHDNKNTLSNDEKIIYGEIADGEDVVQPSLGIQNLKVFKKMIVSPLGEVSEFNFEPRRAARLKTSPKADSNLK